LTSSQLNFLAGNLGNFRQLTIDVGGQREVVSLNTQLSAAEVVAAEQVLTTGRQSLVISANGEATGGSFSLNSNSIVAIESAVGGSITGLVIPHGVKLVDSLSDLQINGRLVNYGDIVETTLKGQPSDSISAGAIYNASGAVINATGSRSAPSLSLDASNSLVNYGSIADSQNITVNSSVLTNAGSIESQQGSIILLSPGNINVTGIGTLRFSSGLIFLLPLILIQLLA